LISTKTVPYRETSIKGSNAKFHGNPFSGSPDVICGQRERERERERERDQAFCCVYITFDITAL
jgi:hypothetical protein